MFKRKVKNIFNRDKNGEIIVEEMGLIKSIKTKTKEYFIDDSLTVRREIVLDQYKLEVETGYTAGKVIEKMKESLELSNKQKFIEGAIVIHNVIDYSLRTTERLNALLNICMLFFNEKDEDVSQWSDSLRDAKLADIMDAGYNAHDFFLLATYFVKDYQTVLKKSPKLTEQFRKAIKNFLFEKK